MSPGIVEDVDRFGTGEDGKPADNRVGEEVRLFGFEDAIARAGHAGHSAAKQSFGEVRSQAELGTEVNRQSVTTSINPGEPAGCPDDWFV